MTESKSENRWPDHPLGVINFRFYIVARLSMTLGITAIVLIIGWEAYNLARLTADMHGSVIFLGLIGLVQFIPLFFLTPLTGWVADRYDRRVISRLTLALLAGAAGLLTAMSWWDALTIPALLLFAALIGVSRAFSGPSMSALAPNLVPRTLLPTAIAISSAFWITGMIAGPALGGFLIHISPTAAFAMCGGLFLLSFFCYMSIGPVAQPPMARDRKPVAQMIDGVLYVRRNRIVFSTITLDLFAVLLAGSTALLPVFARDILHVGAQGLGLLAAAPAAGGALTALAFAIRPMSTNVGSKMLMAVIIFGASTAVFGVAGPLFSALNMPQLAFPVSIAALLVAGSADMISVYVRQSLIQLHTPDEMRGRVSSVSLLTISASNELGEAESGFLAALIGPVAAVVAGGIGAIVITLAWSRLFPELRAAKQFGPAGDGE